MKLGTSGGRQARTRVNASKYGRGREHVNKQAGLNEEPTSPTEGGYSFKLIFYLLKVVHILCIIWIGVPMSAKDNEGPGTAGERG